MPAKLMDGKALAERIRAEVAEEVKELGHVGLTTILVGDDPASDIYIRRKHEAANEIGIVARDYRLVEDTSEQELLELIDQLNQDESVDGILVLLPLPPQIDEYRAICGGSGSWTRTARSRPSIPPRTSTASTRSTRGGFS